MADVYETIVNAANRYGVPVEALLAIAKIESNFQAGADNPNSSASGLFQFTDSTAGDVGLTGSSRNDIEAQAEAAAKMAANNSRSLSSTLGRAPTAGELYLAHQQGLSGAKALLANPDLPATEVLARFHGANAANVIRQNGGNLNMTAGDFANQWVNKGNKTAGLFPPGEIPRVASALSTAPTPSRVTPVTATPDMSLMRKNAAPSQLIPDTFARLPKPSNLGDSLGMNPIQGGTQQAPMFDAGFDERLGAMRTLSTPIDSQGMYTARSPTPPPVPAQMSPQMAGRRATDPVLQAALDARYPQTPQVSASDMARGRSGISTVASIPTTGVGQPPATRTVQSVPVLPRPQVSASDMARGRSGISTVASIPTTPQFSASDMARGRSNVAPVPDRLLPEYMAGAKAAAPPALPGPYSSATLSGDVNPFGQRIAVADANPSSNGAPYPFPRPDFTQPQTQFAQAPFPMPRPSWMPQVATQLAVTPPALPRPRPVPFTRPMQQQPAARAPLRITVNGANPLPAPLSQRPMAQGTTRTQTYAPLNTATMRAPELEDWLTGRAYERRSNNDSLSSI